MAHYTKTFFEQMRDGSRRSAEAILPLVLRLLPVCSVADVGCGDGNWLAVLQKLGINDVLGIDGDYVTRDSLQISEECFRAADLSKPLDLDRTFDLAMSLEVAEHLPTASAATFVESLTRLAPAVLFSAAIPFQGGNHHINEQWPDYWAKLFATHGYLAVDCIRKHVWKNQAVDWWYAQNTILYVREDVLRSNATLKAEYERTNAEQLSLVHPRQFLHLNELYRDANEKIRQLTRNENGEPPFVTVLMSVYNGQEFLSEAIESVLSQTYRDFEFLIIDDGSTDATPELLKKYASEDPRIRVHRHENRGRAESLNVGIELARAKYIARMDADDVALPNRLSRQIGFLEDHPEVGLLGGAFELMSRRGETIRRIEFPVGDTEIRERMLVDNPICHPTVAMRKDVALATGGYRKALVDADDYDLWLRMLERTQAANLDKVVLRYRVHSGQVSVKYLTHQKECVLAARAAAAIRRAGGADPLHGIEKVTPQLLKALGVSDAEVRQQMLSGYKYWIEVLEKCDPETALQAIHGLLELSQGMGRPEIANTWLKAARMHSELGRPMRALFSAGRGVMVRPIIAGRPLKRVFLRLSTALKN